MTSKVTKAFGPRLKWWREQRGLSQLALAGSAETSQRHLSFLESGPRRAEPRDGAAALRRARRAAAPAERPDARGGLRAGVARERSQRPRAGAGQRRARLHAGAAGALSGLRGRPALEPASAPMPGPGTWSPSCSAPRRPARSISPTRSWRPTCCAPSSRTGKRSRCTSCAACRPMRSPTARKRPPSCCAGSRPIRACRRSRASRRSKPTRRCCSIHFRKGDAGAARLHHHRDARHAAGRDPAGNPHRVLLSVGCRERGAVAAWADGAHRYYLRA